MAMAQGRVITSVISPGKTGPRGLFLSRSRMPYENSSEYRRRVEAGENPYPANAPWRRLAPPFY